MPTLHGYPLTYPSDAAQRGELRELLMNWRDVARPDQLHSLRLGRRVDGLSPLAWNLDIGSLPGTCAIPLCEHFEWPAQRGRPSVFDTDLEGVHIKIVKPLQTSKPGDVRLSQVYLAMLDHPDASRVVLKIYQGSATKDLDSLYGQSELDWDAVLGRFHSEEWAYLKMVHLQGTVIPHIGGFFEVLLPHGEPAVALLMEYIEGMETSGSTGLPILARDQSNPERAQLLKPMMKALMAGQHAILNCGVLWFDIAARNIKWLQTTPAEWTSLRAILIDFDSASPLYFAWDKFLVLGSVLATLNGDYGFSGEAINAAVKDVLASDQKLATVFRVTSERELELILMEP
ncbi:hypothetical protein EXIGLDRAFT_832326 [Exidia glandulosa HHB12029]|uniref:Aminoglycoside phosphotransferase domain-containing protein n=1 Tax=Exidia glandulosa HHB12029 TaxID=1314781 RepID=A0A165LRR7_EXIGL|nr:hypothetical protein EXIGLDRAFT_832326 [Exidia glandulosa HHB12029]